MANTQSIVKRVSLGDRVLVVVSVLGDGSTTSVTAASVGLSRIDAAFSHSVDDTGNGYISDYSGTSITMTAVDSGKYRLFFFIGY